MEPGGLTALCQREWPRLVGALSLYTGDRDLAEELAQEALARVCRDWRRVQHMDAPGAWTHRVAMNLARSHWRRVAAGRRARTRMQSLATVDAHTPDSVSAIAIREAVRTLPERQRAALVLRYFGDFSVRETAQIMRCPEGTVKTLTRAGIDSLRREVLVDDESESRLERREA